MKVLILVLASDTEPRYLHLQEQWRRYMTSHEKVDCYFYKADPTIPDKFLFNKSEQTLYCKLEESYETISEKMKMTFSYFEPVLDNYDYIFRTNLSSFVHFDRYIRYCESLGTRTNFCSAVVGNYINSGIPFPSGAGFTLSPDLVRRFIENEYNDNDSIDDVALAFALQHWSIQIQPANRIDIYMPLHWSQANFDDESIYHVRIKGWDICKINDIEYYKTLVDKFYSKDISNCKLYTEYCVKCAEPSDINEHLPTLYKYSKKCSTIIECGVRNIVSSYAFASALYGRTNKYTMIDPYRSSQLDDFLALCLKNNINADFIHKSDIECERHMTDLLFIDTWHVYALLKRELAYWHAHVRKYIILHDTTVDEWQGETIRNGWDAHQQSAETGYPVEEITKGLWPAVTEFLAEHKEWYLKERFTNNNGLTILARIE